MSIALTKNAFGDVLRRQGKLAEALTLLKEALVVRETHDRLNGIDIALSDSNITRDEIAKVHEAMGNCAMALKVREPGKRVCGNGDCQIFNYTELNACSRCKCVFYCSKDCQRADWKNRHKKSCQPVAEQLPIP